MCPGRQVRFTLHPLRLGTEHITNATCDTDFEKVGCPNQGGCPICPVRSSAVSKAVVVSASDVSHTRLNLSLSKCNAVCRPCQWPLLIKCSTVVTSLVIQQLRLRCECRECGFSPCQGTKIPHATWHSQKIEINKGNVLIVSPIIVHIV